MSRPVELTHVEDEGSVIVTVDGNPFTAYRFNRAYDVLGTSMCYPIRTAAGVPITRGNPLDPRPNERVDHRNHIGLRFAYGDVDGADF